VRTRRAWGRAALVLAAVLLVDQVTKAVVRDRIGLGSDVDLVLGARLVHTRNEGIAFGLAAGGQTLVIAMVALALLGLVLYFATHSSRGLIWLPTGLLVGGALGNIADRVRDGAVTDFLKVPYWPAFNVADIAITLGVIALIVVLEREARRQP
jgi:signal peptidase II